MAFMADSSGTGGLEHLIYGLFTTFLSIFLRKPSQTFINLPTQGGPSST
jgi:hypothetical protein